MEVIGLDFNTKNKLWTEPSQSIDCCCAFGVLYDVWPPTRRRTSPTREQNENTAKFHYVHPESFGFGLTTFTHIQSTTPYK